MTREEHEEDNLREVQGYEPLSGRVEEVKTYCAGIIKNSLLIGERHIAWSVINIIDGRVSQREKWIKQLREGT